MAEGATPVEVWRAIERADELLKYAPNRKASEARAQAKAALEEARTLADSLEDRAAHAALAAQIVKRLEDIERLEKE